VSRCQEIIEEAGDCVDADKVILVELDGHGDRDIDL
jgi:hypothetical protein